MAQDGSPPRGREAFHLPKVITRTTRLHEDRTLPELVGWEGLLGQNAIRDRNAQNSRRRSKSDHERKRELRLPEVSPESSREDVGRYGPVRSARTPPLVSVARADVSRAEVSGRKQVEIVSGVIGREENVRPSSRGVVFLKPLNVRENVEADEDWLSSPHLVATPRQLTKLPLQEWRERVAVSSGGVVSSRSEGDIVLTHSVSSSLSNLSPRSMAKVRGSSDYNRGNGTAEKGKSGGDLSGDLQTGGQMAETTGVMISSRPGGQATEESAGALSSMEASWKKEEEYFAVGAAQLSLGNSGPVPGFAEAKEGGVEIDLERGTADPLETAEGFELPPGKRKAVWAPEMLSTIPRVKTPISINESAANTASHVIKHELEGTLLSAQPPNSPHPPTKVPYNVPPKAEFPPIPLETKSQATASEPVPMSPSSQPPSEPVSPRTVARVVVGGASQYRNLPREVRTGEDAIKYFLSRGGSSAGPQLLFLDYASKRAIGGFDPYDLQVVPPSMAGSEHFTMSASGVVHLIEGETSESIPLSVWVHRKSVYNLLKGITFFGKFPLVKAFNTWRTLGRRERFAAASAVVQERLLICSSDRFRTALLNVKAEATRIGHIAIGSLLSRFGPPPYHEKHFNSLRDSECKAAAAAAEEVAAKVLKEVESCCKAVIREVVAANAPPEQSSSRRLKKFELPDKSWKAESTSYLRQQRADQERARARALWHHRNLGVFVRCADAVLLGEVVQATRTHCQLYLDAVAMSRPRGLLHLSASVEEVAAAPAPQNPEPPNPAGGRENLGQASLAQRVLDHEGFAAHMDIDPKVRAAEGVTSAGGQELTSSRISSNIGDRLSGIRAQLDVPAKRDSSTDRRPSIPKSSLESGEHSIRTPQSPPPESLNSSASNEGVEAGYSGPATCLVFEPSFADVALMLEGVLQGIVRALTSGSVRLTHAKELHPVMGSLSRVALAHPKAIVCEAVDLEGLIQRLRSSIQCHVDRVVASEAVAPYVSTGPLCDFATRWTPAEYMASDPSPADFCRDAGRMQGWLAAVQKAKTSFATDLLMVDTQKVKAKLLPLAGATLHGLAVLMGDELKKKIEACKATMESAIAQLRSMPVELEAFLKFVETVQPHLTKGDAAQRLKADVDAIGAMKDLLAQIPDPAASKSAQVAAAWRALKDTQEDYVTVGEVTRAHIKKQAEAVHGALDRSATQLCEQLRQELLSLRVGAFVDPDAPPPRARDALAQKSRRLVSLRASANNCEKQYALLGYDPDRRIQHFLAACEEVLKRKVRLWDALCEWAAFVGKADVAPLLRIGDFLSGAEVRAAVERAQDELRAVLVLKQDGDQVKSGTNTPAEEKFALQLQSRVATWQTILPVLTRLCDGCLRPRHLAQFQKALGLAGEVSVTALLGLPLRTLDAAADAAFAVAREESVLFDRLQKMKMDWQNVYLEVKAAGLAEHIKWAVLGGVPALMRRFAESQAELAHLTRSPFCGGMAGEMEEWEDFLAALQSRVEDAADCQELLDFLGRVFADDDVRKLMPSEYQLFESLSSQWGAMMTSVQLKAHLLAAAQPTSPLAKCAALRDRLAEIQGSFADHLDTLRTGFPRLYFLSDPEVLSLAAARDFSAVSHLVTKCFTGVSSLVIQTRGVNPSSGAEAEPSERTFIAAVEGPQGEALTLNRLLGTVRIPARVDRWMGRLLDVVRKTLAAQTKEVLDGEAATPAAQSILLADAIRWTADVDDALADASNDNARGKPSEKSEAASVQRQTPSESVSERLSRLSEKLDAESESLRSAVKDSGESGAISGDRTTLDGWRLVAVEARKQVLGRLMAADDAFLEWKKELRYTWQEETDSCTVHMGDCSIPYGFEYLGDDLLSPLPMITTSPATLSLFSALSTGQFVAQTEPEAGGVNTLAELARACGRLYLPSVCTGALDYRSTARLLTGAAESGAWLSLSNVDALSPAVTSLLTQQLHALQTGITRGAQLVSVEGADISVQPGFAAALSLPRGAILERLPHLRTLVDWTCHVVESDSFQIPPTPLHKPAGKRVSATGQERERLREILLQQIAQSSLPFDAESFASNCLDLFDALSHSTAVFVTGDALSGKTSCWRTLAAALEALYGVTGNREGGQTRVQGEEGWVNARVMCPGALTQEELLGAYGQTHQWENGLLPTLCSDFSARPGSGNGITFPRNWAVFDGDLPGPHWALLEPLVAAKGSLCLPSGERFRVPAGAALIFETPGVSKLTPAALSDTKIVHLNREETVSAKVVSKWVLNLPTEIFFLKGHLAGLVGAAKPLWTMGGGSEPGSRSGASVNTTHFIALFEHLMRKDPHVVAARKLSQSAEEGAAKSAAESAGNKTNGEVLTGHILSRSFSLDKQPGGTPKQAKCPPGSAGELAEAIHTAEQMATLYFVFCILWAIGGSASDRSRGELECRVRERFDGLAPKGAFPLSDNGSLFDLRVCGVKRAFVPWLGSANPGDFHPVTLPGLTYPRHSSPLLHVPTVESERARAVLELAIVGGLPPLLIGPPSSRKSFIMQLAASNLITKEEFASATAFMTRGTSAASLSDVLKAHLVPGGKRKALRTPLGQRLLVVIDDVHLSFEGPKSASEAPGSLELLRQVLGSGTMYRSAERSSVEITGLQLALTGEPGEPTLPIRLNGRVFTLAINDPPPQSVCQAILATCVNTLSTGEVPLPSAHEMTSAAADALVAVQKLCRVRLTSVRNPAERARVTSASRVLGLGAFARALRALRRLHESHTQLDGIPAGGMTGERNEHRADGAGRKRESSSDLDVPNFVGLLKKAQKGRGSDGGTERAEPEGAESGGFEGLGIPWPEVLRGAVMESVGTRADEGFRALLDGALADAVEKAGEKVARARATMMPLAQKPANLLRGGEWPVPERKGGSGTLAERQIWRAKLWAIWEEKKEDGEHVAVANANPVAAKATKHVQFKEDKTKVQRGKAASPQPTAPLRQPDVTETSANPLESFPEAEIHFAKLVDLLVGGEALAVIGPPCCGKRRIVTAALKFLGSEAVEITAASPETSSMDIIRDLREGMLRAAAEKPAKGSASASLLIGNVIAENVDVLTWLADAVVSGRIPRDESERKTASAGKGRAKNQQSSGNKISSRDQPPTDAQSKPATCPRVVLLCTDATWRALTDGFPELQKRLRVWRFNPPADLAVMEFADRGLGRVWDTQPEQALRQRADWNFSDEKGGYLLRQNKINDLWKDRPAPPPDAPNPPEALEGFGSWAPSSAAAAAAAVYERARALLAAQGLEVSLAGRQLGAFVRLAGGLWRGAKGVLRRRRRGLEACLDRLQAIQKGLVKSNDDADGLQPALEALLEQSTALLAEIAARQKAVDLERAELARDDRELQLKLREIESLTSASQTELRRTAEVYEDALSGISHLARDDMVELKSFSTPPPLVKTVMEAVCLLMGTPPDWDSARRMLADNEARSRIAGLDKDRIPDKTLKALQKYVHHPSFTPAAVEQVSKACCSLCMWVLAVVEYARARASVKEKGRRLGAVQRKVDEEAIRLQERRQRLQAEESEMGRLKRAYVEVMGKQTQAEARLADVYQSGDRSSLLLRHLAGRRPIWERQLSAMRAQLENLPGDAILAAGIATFLGALTLAEKKACLADWAKGCAEAGLSTSVGIGSSFGLRSWLRNVTPATSVVRQLTASPAGSETEPVGDDGMEKMTSAMYGHRPPLIVDPDEDFERLGGLATLGVAFQAGQTGQSAGSTGPGSHADVSSADVAGFRWKHVRAAAAGALQKAREALDNGAKVCLQIDGPSSDPWPDLMVAADVFAYVQELQKKAKAARKEQVPMNSDSAVPLDDVSRGLLPLAELRGPHDVILYTTHPNPGALPGYVTGLWNVLDFSVESPGGSAAENGIGNGKSAEDRMLGAVAEHVIPEVEARGRMLRASLETMRQTLQVHEERIVSAFGAHRDSDASEQNPPVSEDDTTLAEIEANAVASEALTLHIEGALLTLEEVNLSREVYRLLSDRASLVFAAARALSRDDGAHFVSWARFKGLVLQGMGVAAGIEDGTEPRTGRTESRTDRTERNSGRAEQRNAGIKDGTGPRTRWTALRTGRTERKTGRAEQRNAGTSGTDSDSEEESARGEASPERSPLSSGLSDRRTRVSISDAANATSDATGEVPYGHLQNFAEQLELFRRNRESSGRAESLVERLTSFLLDRLAARLTSAEARSLGGAVTGRLLAAEGFGGNNEWEWIASRGLCARAGGSAGITDISTTSTEEVDKGEAKRLGTIIMENKRKSELVSGEQGGIEMGTLAKGGGTSEKERPSPAKAAQISRLAELQQEFPGRPNPFAVALKVLEGTLGRLTENKDETLAEPVTGIAPEKLPTFADYLAACKAEPATEKLGILQQVALFQALYPDALPSALAWLSATLLGAPTDLDADSDVSTDAESDVIRGGVESGEVPEESPRAGLEPRQLTLSGISDVTWRGEVGVPPEKRNRKTSAKRALRLVKQALGETSVERPLVVVRATSGFAVIDVINRLARLEEIPSDVIATVCLGQNHGGEAEEAIYTAQRSGGWVCILGLETESEWSNRLCELVYEVAGGKSYVHPTCRLWVHYQLCRSDVERRVESNCEELGRPLPEGFLAGTTCNVVCIG